MNLIFELLIGFCNVFGWISESYISWNPFLGVITIPSRSINISSYFPSDSRIYIDHICFKSIVITFSFIGRLILHVHFNDSIIQLTSSSSIHDPRRSPDRSNNTNIDKNKSSSFLSAVMLSQSQYISLLQYLSPFIGLYFNHAEIAFQMKEEEVSSCIYIDKLWLTLSIKRTKYDYNISYESLEIDAMAEEHPWHKSHSSSSRLSLLKSTKLQIFLELDLIGENNRLNLDLDSLTMSLESYTIIAIIDLFSQYHKLFRPTHHELLLHFHTHDDDSIRIRNSNLTSEPSLSSQPSSFRLSSLTFTIKEINILQSELAQQNAILFLSVRSIKCASNQFMDRDMSLSLIITSIRDSDSNLIGEMDAPWLKLETNIDDHQRKNLTCRIEESELAISIDFIASILFLCSELSVINRSTQLTMVIIKPHPLSRVIASSASITPAIFDSMDFRADHLKLSLISTNSQHIPLHIFLKFVQVRCSRDDLQSVHFSASCESLYASSNDIASETWTAEEGIKLKDVSIEHLPSATSEITRLAVKEVQVTMRPTDLFACGSIFGKLSATKPASSFAHGLCSPLVDLSKINALTRPRDLDIEISSIHVSLQLDDNNMSASPSQAAYAIGVTIKHGIRISAHRQDEHHSKTSLYLRDKELQITSSSSTQTSTILTTVIAGAETGGRPDHADEYLLLEAYSQPSYSFISSDGNLALGQISSAVCITFHRINLAIDYFDLYPLLRSIAIIQAASSASKSTFLTYLCNYHFLEVMYDRSYYHDYQHVSLSAIHHPSSVLSLHLDELHVNFSHDRIAVLSVQCHQLVYSTVAFGAITSQLSVSLESLVGVDLTDPNAVHTTIACNLPEAATVPMNHLELHITSRLGEASIMELRGEYIEYTYLQRTTMTMVNYFRDHLLKSIFATLSSPQTAVGSTVRSDLKELYRYPINGIFRFALSIRRLEAHIPVNSYANDSLTIIAGHGIFYKSCPVIDALYPLYTRAPYLARRIWMSESRNIRAIMESLKHGSDSIAIDQANIHWNLPASDVQRELITPDGMQSQASILRFDIQLLNATICSWCNQNAIGEHIDLSAYLTIESTMIGSANGLQPEVIDYSADEYMDAADESRNKIIVDIASKEVDWILSQGQYSVIVYMIMQNFCEFTLIVPEIWPTPTPKIVPLTERVYGADCMKHHLPIFSSVPIHIQRGKILAIENTDDYYELIQRPIKATVLDLLAIRRFSEVLQSYHAVPDSSFHHRYRKRLFDSLSSHNLLRSITSASSSLNCKDFTPSNGKAVLTVIFHGLEVDVYRRHYGGGTGIEASAQTFVIVDNHSSSNIVDGRDQNTFAQDEDRDSDISRTSNLDDILPQHVVFAPKNLACMSGERKQRMKAFYRDEDDDAEHENITSPTSSNSHRPHIRYSQQGIGNLRRCIIEIDDSIAVAHINPILTAISYFTEPTYLYYLRNIGRIEQAGQGPYDYKAALDVEVHAMNTVFCLPNITVKDGASGICVSSDFHYTHAWRGYLLSGPGSIKVEISLLVYSVFISPLHEVRVVGAESVIDPCTISFVMDLLVLAKKSEYESHYQTLSSWLTLPGPCLRPSRLQQVPVAVRNMILSIIPTDPTASQSGKIHPQIETAITDVSKANDGEAMAQIAENVRRSVVENQSPDEVVSIVRVLQLRLSLQDITFLIVSIQQLMHLVRNRHARASVMQRYPYLLQNFFDLHHLPLLTYYLVYAPLSATWNECDIDILGKLSDIQAIFRNNTYNITIGKVDIVDIQLSFNKSSDNLHAAIGLACSAWSFNSSADVWEPVIEPVQLSSVAATDSTNNIHASDPGREVSASSLEEDHDSDYESTTTMSTTKASSSSSAVTISMPTTKLDVYSNPLELTVSLMSVTSLIRRLKLADVVTTSSAHLPPYLIINELGLSVKCSVGMGNHMIISESILAGNQLPIEVHQLASARLHTKILRRKSLKSEVIDSMDDDKEHLLNISFEMLGQLYESAKPLSIAKEGIFCFEIQLARQGKADSKGYFSRSTNPPKSAMDDIPLVLLSMRIKDDGGREIVLRSILSFKNLTHRAFQLSMRRGEERMDTYLAPGAEWIVPVQFAHPRSTLYMQVSDRSGWFEALTVLQSLMTQGQWGWPTKLRAELVSCPPEHASSEGQRLNWVVLLRPEVKDSKPGISSKSTIPVKYPTGDPYRPTTSTSASSRADAANPENVDDSYNFSRLQAAATAVTSGSFIGNERSFIAAQPMCVHMIAPLQLLNVLCTPLIYRLASTEGLILAEGVLLPGEITNLHNLYQLFTSSIFLSIRMINYAWSKWTKILSKRNPFPSQEKITELRLPTMNLIYDDNELKLPTVDIMLSMREHFLRFSCPVLLANKTGWPLQYCETGSPELILPQSSGLSLHNLIHLTKRNTRRSTLALNAELAMDASQNHSFFMNRADESDAESPHDVDGSPMPDTSSPSTATAYTPFTSPAATGATHGSIFWPSSPNNNVVADVNVLSPGVLPFRSPGRTPKPKLKNLLIHLPSDHLRLIEITASMDWSLRDLFQRIMGLIAVNSINQQDSNYVFIYWDDGKYGPRKIETMPMTIETTDKVAVGAAGKDDSDDEYPVDATTPKQRSNKSSSGGGSEKAVPENMRFNMLVDCLTENLLSYDMKVEQLKDRTRIRLCHISELNLFNQVNAIRSEAEASASENNISSFMSLFSRVKVIHRAPLYPWGGDYIPFHHHKLIGFTNSFSIRVESSSEWTDGIDLSKLGFEGGNASINASIWTPSEVTTGVVNRIVEFGVYVERGKGLFQNITTLCVVPRHILISKLSEPLEFRQLGVDDVETYTLLKPEDLSVIHHHYVGHSKLLQVRRPAESSSWCGEIDIAHLGIVYLKLQNPSLILKVQVEMVGASLVATISEQNPRWPPYRIDNHSHVPIRIRQSIAMASNRSVPVSMDKSNDNASATPPSSAHGVKSSIDEHIAAWENIPSSQSLPYAWDMPISGGTLLQVEFPQGSGFKRVDINLDEIAKSKHIKILKASVASGLGNPAAEGQLFHREIGDIWSPAYCILKGATVYMYRDESRDEMLNILNLFKLAAKEQVQYAKISRYTEKSAWGDKFMTSFGLTGEAIGSGSHNNQSNHFDVNYARVLILRLAERLKMSLIGEDSISGSNSKRSRSPTRSKNTTGKENDGSLVSALAHGYSVDHILDNITGKPINARELITAIVDIGQAENEIAALGIYNTMLATDIIKLHIASPKRSASNEAMDKMHDQISIMDELDAQLGSEISAPPSDHEGNDSNDEGLDDSRSKTKMSLETFASRASSSYFPTSLLSSAVDTKRTTVIATKKKSPAMTLESLKSVEVSFQVVMLNPELLSHTLTTSSNTATDALAKDETNQAEVFGFTIQLGASRHHFKCTSMMEYLGWIQACRHNVEQVWIDSLTKQPRIPIVMESLYAKVHMRVRADGPTKVLEIMDDVNDVSSSGHKGSHRLSVFRTDITDTYIPTKLEDFRITDALSVKIAVESIGLSIVDGEPVEVLHLALQDIEMTIDRSRYLVRMATTVQRIHVGNQLLNPLYPVALVPRCDQAHESNMVAKGLQRLMLPGLHQRGRQLPSLHLYFQERYQDQGNGINPDYESNHLLYFEMFSLWLAPLQLDLDEELIIRLIRYIQSVRAVYQSAGLSKMMDTVNDEILTNQYRGNRTWGINDQQQVTSSYQQFITSVQACYSSFDIFSKASTAIYFSLLQLHPLDVVVHIRPSPNFHITATEMTLISIVAQVDSSRICLNALIAEHAFGSTGMILDIITKHYRAALWRQFQKLIGSADIVEGSVGLVANLGTGVYDLFYEPIDGLMGDSGGSFLDGLSKGGKSLATRTIGGTSAFTSKITGGLGRGMSMLTLDSDFQRLRNSRRLTKANSVSEGIYVGTRELGKNIVDGVTGIVKAPYRGWEEGGGVGLSVGIAKGLLGVALKPAVGVFDLASRATEGLRNTAFQSESNPIDDEGRYIIAKRYPRSFGRQEVLLPYDPAMAASQYIADRLIHFSREHRFRVVHHQHIRREVVGSQNHRSTSLNNPMSNYTSPHHEAWGMRINDSYLAVISPERVALFQINSPHDSTSLALSFIWCCPAMCINELFSDNKGDLILSLSQNVRMHGSWYAPTPVILDKQAQDYLIFQLILEQTIGMRHARAQPLHPRGGLIDTDVYKRLSTGLRSLVYSPTKHTFQLVGHVLYEYTIPTSTQPDRATAAAVKTEPATGAAGGAEEGQASDTNTTKYPSDRYFAKAINQLFGCESSKSGSMTYIGSNNTNDDTDDSIEPEGYLSFVYPLVDVAIMGPYVEDNNKCSISISNRDTTARIKALRREHEDALLSDYNKTILTLVFSSRDRALVWKQYLEKHMITAPKDVISSATAGAKMMKNHSRVLTASTAIDADEPIPHSIMGMLVIPSSGLDSRQTEELKIEIAKTLSSARKF
jgi:hypothetical protein